MQCKVDMVLHLTWLSWQPIAYFKSRTLTTGQDGGERKGTPQGNLESKNAAFNRHQDQPLKKLTASDGSPFVYEVPDKPGMTLAEKKRLVEYVLMKKVVSHPEKLNDAQKEELNKAVKSVGTKFKEGMNKFALKAINQCRLM